LASDVTQELGRAESRLLPLFDAALTEIGQAILAKGSLDPRELKIVIRDTWTAIRWRMVEDCKTEAARLPLLITEDGKRW